MARQAQCPLAISLKLLDSSAYNRIIAADNMLSTGTQLTKLDREKVLSFF